MASFTLSSTSTVARTLLAGEFGNITLLGALSVDGDAITTNENNTSITNAGSIFATSNAIAGTGTGGTISNTGHISAQSSLGVLNVGSSSALSSIDIFNSGTIHGLGSGADGILIQSGGNRIVNSGEIIGDSDDGIQINANFEGGSHSNEIFNSGLISAPSTGFDFAINTFSDADTVTNTGVIDGNVVLGAGNDVFNGLGGRVTGEVQGGADDDLYIIDDPLIELAEFSGQGTDEVRAAVSWTLGNNFENLTLIGGADIDGGGNGLDNVLDGNLGDNTLIGRDGNDTLSGRGGDDLLDGGAGNDRAFGGEGADHLRGRLGNDVLVADEGDDRLQGDLGNDRLFGNDGEDLLIGGEGQDDLFGGRAADVFRFRSVAEVGVGAGRDVIEDFEQGTDLIDLFQIDADVTQSGDQAFTLIAGAFSGTAGELRFSNAGGNTFVDGDVDGDAVLDFRLEITGLFALNGGDFLL